MSITMPQPGAASPPKQIVDPGKTRRRGWVLSLVAGVLATIAGSAFFMYLNQYEAEIGVKQPVVVAAKAIPARALITPDMLTTTELPVKYLPPSYLLNQQDLLDGQTTALINIAPGEYVQQNMVSRNSGLEPGRRAVSVAIDPITSVGNSVRQGNFVDVLVSYTDPQGRARTEVLLQNVKVLAVDALLPAQGGTGGQTYLPAGIDGQVKLAPSTVATLELSPEEAVRVTHAANFAKELRLVIRRLDEQGTPNIAPADFIGGGRAQGVPQDPDTVPAPGSQPEGSAPAGDDSGR
ncbi:MAG TPA: Flp pilus assembly protein CpaB [Roseiflexaceae bacterium]|nr:Flp pilus assembly protein CpaB [Roseiflexaceae bacterium]